MRGSVAVVDDEPVNGIGAVREPCHVPIDARQLAIEWPHERRKTGTRTCELRSLAVYQLPIAGLIDLECSSREVVGNAATPHRVIVRRARPRPQRVESLPPAFAGLCREILVEPDEQVDEFAAHRRSTKQCWQLGQIDKPVRVPGCPIRIIAVHDAVDTVVRLRSLCQKLPNPGFGVVHLLRANHNIKPPVRLTGTSSLRRSVPRLPQRGACDHGAGQSRRRRGYVPGARIPVHSRSPHGVVPPTGRTLAPRFCETFEVEADRDAPHNTCTRCNAPASLDNGRRDASVVGSRRLLTTPYAEIDLRPGGAYLLIMQPTEGEPLELRGTYREIERPRRLVFTCRWASGVPDTHRLSLSKFEDLGNRTRVVVLHGELDDESPTEPYEYGWQSELDKLAIYAAAHPHPPGHPMPHAEHRVVIKRPAADVFSYFADGEKSAEWRSGVIEVKKVSGEGSGPSTSSLSQRPRRPSDRR